ncbi:unnamed protein product [Acanthoscelides obtectus]|uniref:Uncharacterized protein n=1 Tax=Acanthoscelides obtectus TaxID=200917 RepID=A0A9P0JSS9_ACAOB|nr:unnamed protein product [Acanthoscelides obtectus]CAK1621916.1 hypothetical protein AOBTE_LOCUS1215 [Acanthoscelides obtectus]
MYQKLEKNCLWNIYKLHRFNEAMYDLQPKACRETDSKNSTTQCLKRPREEF